MLMQGTKAFIFKERRLANTFWLWGLLYPSLLAIYLGALNAMMFQGCVNSLENYYLEWECWLESENPPVQCTAENNYQFTQ